jgi:DNA replication initiation complex subunit (GINS family)
MHTYEEIYQKWLKEWNAKKIQSVTDEFCTKIGEYFKKSDVIKLYEDLTLLEKKLFEIKYKRLNFLIKDFFTLRLSKIVNTVIEQAEVDFTNLTKIEDKLCSNLKEIIATYLNLVFLKGPSIKDEDTYSKRRVVRILERLDSFVGIDLKIYGPFMPEDICVLPNENAKALIDRNVAVTVEIEGKIAKKISKVFKNE